jgi:hypothetical protein
MATTTKPNLESPDLALVPTLGPESAVIWPPRTRHKLANGLEVVLVESHTIPKFTGEPVFPQRQCRHRTRCARPR